ncbi:MAG: NUDIX domain-containing protein [Actinomycetia bacterium]|nr:NUDIX domain-containing protein [Actinomycetes bacterium]
MTLPDQCPDGYVADVRAQVGNRLLLLPAVSVHIRDDVGRLLLVHQIDRQQWGTVGGAVEPGESPADAAVREAREETGLEVELTGLVAALGGPGFQMTYPNGDECAYISIVFDARVVGGELVADGVEVSQCAWFTKDDLETADISTVSRSVLLAVGALQPAAATHPE